MDMKKLVRESLNEKEYTFNPWDIAGRLYPTSDEEIETSNDLLIITYAAEVIDDLQNISHVDKNTMEKICNEYNYLIEKGFDEDEDAIVIAQEIWDLWLNDPQY